MGAYLQNWIDCNNDSGLNKIIVFLSKEHLCCIFFFFSFLKYKISFWFCPTFLLLLLILLHCFYVINYVAVAPGALNQDQRNSDDRYCTDCEDCPHSFPIQKQRHRKWGRKAKGISYDLWMCPSSSEFSGHALCLLLYYWLYTDLNCLL